MYILSCRFSAQHPPPPQPRQGQTSSSGHKANVFNVAQKTLHLRPTLPDPSAAATGVLLPSNKPCSTVTLRPPGLGMQCSLCLGRSSPMPTGLIPVLSQASPQLTSHQRLCLTARPNKAAHAHLTVHPPTRGFVLQQRFIIARRSEMYLCDFFPLPY